MPNHADSALAVLRTMEALAGYVTLGSSCVYVGDGEFQTLQSVAALPAIKAVGLLNVSWLL